MLLFSRNKPGLLASVVAHAAILLAGIVAFSSPPKFTDQQETIAVEVISEEAFSTMTQGDRTAKTVLDNPKPRVDRIAEIEETKPDPGEAKRDVPAPVSRPVAEDKSEDRTAVEADPKPEIAPLPPQPKPVPEPAPASKPSVPEPAEEPAKPEPKPAETVSPTPPTPQKRPPQLAKTEPVKPEPKKPEIKQPAAAKEPVKAASRSQESKAHEPDAIEKLLASKDRAQTSGSSGKEQQAASAGTRTGSALKLSLSQRDALGNLMKSQIRRCFVAPPGFSHNDNLPSIRMQLNEDGTLATPPEVISGANDAASRSYAESAMRAIRRCAPYSIPPQFAPYYDDWRDWNIELSSEDFL